MNADSQMTIGRGTAVGLAAALLLAGAMVAYVVMRSSTSMQEQGSAVEGTEVPRTAASATPTSATAIGNAHEPLADVVVPLSQDAAERAGIVVTSAASGTPGTPLRVPGLVAPDAYRQVVVTPLVAGRITRTHVELGEAVRVGQTLAEVYSPELAEAQTRYVSLRAELDAHDRELQRTERLVEIGAASRQELERIHAEHAAQTARVQSARSTLELLGVAKEVLEGLGPGARVETVTHVPAPLNGVVTERQANVGLNVNQDSPLFTVVDLSRVWIIADLYERDFSRVGVGTEATITTDAYPDLTLQGRVSYIDPQVNVQTRTAKVRIEVANPRQRLRFGMYVDVAIAGTSAAESVLVPRSAIQTVGDRQVVYLAGEAEASSFIEREVRIGAMTGVQVVVVSGLRPGDRIVTEGSFFVRAERERLGLRAGVRSESAASASAMQAPAAGTSDAAQPAPASPSAVQTTKVLVSAQGFEPATVTLRAGTPARLTFLRTTDQTCATEVVFPSLDVRRTLPLNEPVDIDFTPAEAGEIAFACGMNMLRGSVVVK